MELLKQFLHSAIVFLMGTVLSKLAIFLVLPILTFHISPDQYGKYDFSINIMQLLISTLFLNIWSSVIRYMFDYSEASGKRLIVSNGIAVFFAAIFLYTVIFYFVNKNFVMEYWYLVYFLGILTSLDNMYAYITRGYAQNRLFAISGVVETIIHLTLSLILVVYFGLGYQMLYISSSIGLIAKICILEYFIRPLKAFKKEDINKLIIYDMLRFSLPLMINSAAYWFLTSYNRIIITEQLSFSDNGLYAISMKIAAPISVLAVCFQMAWQEMAFSHASNSKQDRTSTLFYSNAINLYIKIISVLIVITMIALNTIFPKFIDRSYLDALDIIPWCVLAISLTAFSAFLGDIFSALKQTKFLFLTLLISGVINCFVLISCIEHLGVLAAPLALFMSFFINCYLRIIFLKRYIEINLDYKFIILTTCIIGGTVAALSYGHMEIAFLLLIIISAILYISYKNDFANLISRVISIRTKLKK